MLKRPRAKATDSKAPAVPAHKLNTLAIDIGGTGLKASILDGDGAMLTERVRVATPPQCSPELMVETLAQLVAPLPEHHRVSVGFPGVVRRGVIITAHNLGTDAWRGFALDRALSEKLGKPVRALNDADIQGLGAIKGEGVEVVITLGTGLGSSIFEDGRLSTHLELAHHPFRKGETYEEQLGNAALESVGKRKWKKEKKKEAMLSRAPLTTTGGTANSCPAACAKSGLGRGRRGSTGSCTQRWRGCGCKNKEKKEGLRNSTGAPNPGSRSLLEISEFQKRKRWSRSRSSLSQDLGSISFFFLSFFLSSTSKKERKTQIKSLSFFSVFLSLDPLVLQPHKHTTKPCRLSSLSGELWRCWRRAEGGGERERAKIESKKSMEKSRRLLGRRRRRQLHSRPFFLLFPLRCSRFDPHRHDNSSSCMR